MLTIDGVVHNGFILKEDDDTISLGVADAKGAASAKQIDILKDDIEIRKEMKASSMPEGLIKQIAPLADDELLNRFVPEPIIALIRDKIGSQATDS